MKTSTRKALGWAPDLPDCRDYTFSRNSTATLPASVDLTSQLGPVFDQGQLGSCHDAETEVLTEHGWRIFADLHGDERLATVNPETAELTYEMPIRIVRFPYVGKLLCTKNQSLNFRVTPEHNLLVRKWDESARTLGQKFELVPAENLGWYAGLMNRVVWKGEASSDVAYRLLGVAHKHKPQREDKDVPMGAWLRFLGIYLAEGTMLKSDQCAGRVSYKIQLAASKEREKQFIRETLAALDLQALELRDRFTFSNRRVYEAMTALGLKGVKAKKKFVPSFVFSQPAKLISEFLAGHFAGDGCEQRGMRAHYTSSKQLADDLQRLIFLSGDESRISIRPARTATMLDGRNVVGGMDECRVSVCERKNLSIDRRESVFTVDYNGEVFCAELPTHHTLVTRREGKILISGNCTANALSAAVQFELAKQGRCKLDTASQLSRLFIYYFERSIEGTVKTDSGAQIRDGVKALSKQGVCLESAWPYNIAKFKNKPMVAAVKSALGGVIKTYKRISTHEDRLGCLATGFPFVLGFTVYGEFESDAVAKTGIVPMPSKKSGVLGGHAVLCCGYDMNAATFLCRNSWGDAWGKAGNFTIPFAYIDNPNLSDDHWVINA